MGFSRQEYWNELSFPFPGDRPDPRIKPTAPVLAGEFFTTKSTWEARLAGYPHAKNEVGSLPHIIYKNQLTVDQRPKCKSWI